MSKTPVVKAISLSLLFKNSLSSVNSSRGINFLFSSGCITLSRYPRRKLMCTLRLLILTSRFLSADINSKDLYQLKFGLSIPLRFHFWFSPTSPFAIRVAGATKEFSAFPGFFNNYIPFFAIRTFYSDFLQIFICIFAVGEP